jgi:hypothetical protein
MGKTTVTLTIPFTSAPEGKYQVSYDGKIANIEITYVQNDEALNRTMGIEAMGKRQLSPSDPQGMANVSKVTIEIPFEFSDSDITDDGSEKLNPVILQCVAYLNRLHEVIRYHTNQYWLKSISPYHLNIFEIVRQNDEGKGRQFKTIAPPPENLFPAQVKGYAEVQSQISDMLLKETSISLSDKLYQDALNFFYFFSFTEAIITANTALEVFVWRHLFERYKSQTKNEDKAKTKVEDIFDGNFHKVMKNQYFPELDKEDLKNHPIWKIFDDARRLRGSIVHPHTKIPKLEETRKVLLDISQIMEWVSKQV